MCFLMKHVSLTGSLMGELRWLNTRRHHIPGLIVLVVLWEKDNVLGLFFHGLGPLVPVKGIVNKL